MHFHHDEIRNTNLRPYHLESVESNVCQRPKRVKPCSILIRIIDTIITPHRIQHWVKTLNHAIIIRMVFSISLTVHLNCMKVGAYCHTWKLCNLIFQCTNSNDINRKIKELIDADKSEDGNRSARIIIVFRIALISYWTNKFDFMMFSMIGFSIRHHIVKKIFSSFLRSSLRKPTFRLQIIIIAVGFDCSLLG